MSFIEVRAVFHQPAMRSFDELDVNKDGVIDREEFRRLQSDGVSWPAAVTSKPADEGDSWVSKVNELKSQLRQGHNFQFAKSATAPFRIF